MRKPITSIITGSKLYGVALPDSDTDIKSVFTMTQLSDFYSGFDHSIRENNGLTGAALTEYEHIFCKQFAKLLCSGQTIAMDMLFAPDQLQLITSYEWGQLLDNRDRCISKNVFPFVSYARSQAIKYSIKGERLRTLKDFVIELKKYNFFTADGVDWFEDLKEIFEGRPGIRFWNDEKGGVITPMIEICGKSFGKTTALKLWIPPLEKLVADFGDRSEAAMMSDGKDLKAMYHAVRIVDQCVELLKEGTITFPRPNADYLKAIRLGQVSLEVVSNEIDAKTDEMNALILTSTLPDKPDEAWINQWAWETQQTYF